jgi:hypothetical protein
VTGASVVSTCVTRFGRSAPHVSVRWTLQPTPRVRAFHRVMGVQVIGRTDEAHGGLEGRHPWRANGHQFDGHIVLQPYPSEDSNGGHSAEFKRSILGVHGSQQFQAIRAIRLIAGKRSSFHVRPYCRAQRVAQRFTDGLHAVMCSNSRHHVGRVCPLAATSMQPAPLTADSEHNIRRVCSGEPANRRARNSHGTVASKPESSSGRPSCTSSRLCPARHPLLCDRTAVPQIP